MKQASWGMKERPNPYQGLTIQTETQPKSAKTQTSCFVEQIRTNRCCYKIDVVLRNFISLTLILTEIQLALAVKVLRTSPLIHHKPAEMPLIPSNFNRGSATIFNFDVFPWRKARTAASPHSVQDKQLDEPQQETEMKLSAK